MELQKNKWEILNVDLSTFLEDSYKNSVLKANFENKYQVHPLIIITAYNLSENMKCQNEAH